MEIIVFTLVALVLYLFCDWVVQRVEVRLGRRLEYRTLVFFVLLTGLALISFALIRRYLYGV